MEKNAKSPKSVEKCEGSTDGIGDTVSQTMGPKNQRDTECNCDTTTYVLILQCHNFRWRDNLSIFGT